MNNVKVTVMRFLHHGDFIVIHWALHSRARFNRVWKLAPYAIQINRNQTLCVFCIVSGFLLFTKLQHLKPKQISVRFIRSGTLWKGEHRKDSTIGFRPNICFSQIELFNKRFWFTFLKTGKLQKTLSWFRSTSSKSWKDPLDSTIWFRKNHAL